MFGYKFPSLALLTVPTLHTRISMTHPLFGFFRRASRTIDKIGPAYRRQVCNPYNKQSFGLLFLCVKTHP
jgi:hypothetical protein